MNNMKTVLLFGTFDFLHSGHIFTFEEAKKLGDVLVVSVARDIAIETIKGKKPLHSEEERLALVNHINIVEDAFLGDEKLGVYSFFESVLFSLGSIVSIYLWTDIGFCINKKNHENRN